MSKNAYTFDVKHVIGLDRNDDEIKIRLTNGNIIFLESYSESGVDNYELLKKEIFYKVNFFDFLLGRRTYITIEEK